MTVTTRSKRASAVAVLGWFVLAPEDPDSLITAGDRVHEIHQYVGRFMVVEFPPGAILFFNNAACPTGWTEVTAARGRLLVGLPLGGTLAGTVSAAVGNLGARTVSGIASHTHDAGSITTDSSGDHGHGFNYAIWPEDEPRDRVYSGLGAGGYIPTSYGGDHSHSVVSGATGDTSVGHPIDVMMPYIQLRICRKT